MQKPLNKLKTEHAQLLLQNRSEQNADAKAETSERIEELAKEISDIEGTDDAPETSRKKRKAKH